MQRQFTKYEVEKIRWHVHGKISEDKYIFNTKTIKGYNAQLTVSTNDEYTLKYADKSIITSDVIELLLIALAHKQ